MSAEEWALIVTVIFAGSWSGLLTMLTTILHPIMKQMDGPAFREFLGEFLPVARKAPFNYIAVAVLVIGPAVALFALDDTGSTEFLLTAIGLGVTLVGVFGVSNRLAEPNYDVILGWGPKSLPSDWEAVQGRYFALNWIRFVATWIALGLFMAALVELLRS